MLKKLHFGRWPGVAKSLLLAFWFLFIAASRLYAQAPAQTRADLEKERAAIQKEIEDVKRSLDETHRNKREMLGQLGLLQRRLRLRESAIRNINDQINVIQGDMNESWREILKLRNELDTLRIQYAQSIDRKSTRLNSSHFQVSRMPSSA